MAEVKIHLIKMSTGEPHPVASQPVIGVPRMPFLPGNCSVSIEIVGDTLGVLFNLSRFLHGHGAGAAITFLLYNWKTGKLRLVSLPSRFLAQIWAACASAASGGMAIPYAFSHAQPHNVTLILALLPLTYPDTE